MTPPLPDAALAALAAFDTCAIANAIERFDVRLRNEGFTSDQVRCHFPERPPTVGYAGTRRVHRSNPPLEGGAYAESTGWGEANETVPAPRVVVVHDSDRRTGVGALIGEVHAAILRALGCVCAITNGAVRDLAAVGSTGFQLFSSTVSVSHAYMHVVEINTPVEIAGLRIKPGDLLHGDRHGIVRIPQPIAAELPEVIARMKAHERRILEFCRSPQFSRAGLRQILSEPS